MNDTKSKPMFERHQDLEDKIDGPDVWSAVEASEKRAVPLVGSGSLVGAVRRPKNRSEWTRGYVCAIATNWRHHQCPTATRDLLMTAGRLDHILAHADLEDIETLQSAGFLSPNTEVSRGT